MSCILLVDDDESFSGATKMVLESLGHEVVMAANGEVGKQYLLTLNTIDLVISDIRMPGMSGLDLTRFIKAQKPKPVILITGFSEVLETCEAHTLGADQFIAKPFSKADLKEAIAKCLSPKPELSTQSDREFCKLCVDDFVSGREIKFNIFVRLADKKFVKVAHRGEDLSLEKIKNYKSKGIFFLYLRKEDFREYIGIPLKISRAMKAVTPSMQQKKERLMKHTGEILMERICHDGLDIHLYENAVTFLETTVEVISDNEDCLNLLTTLNEHTDALYAHSVGVALYSVLLTKALDWNLPTNRFKIAMAGLFHDIGQKELDPAILNRPRHQWSREEVIKFEDHCDRGVAILSKIPAIPEEVLRVAREHHEDCLSGGYPQHLKRSLIHPMAKIVSIANEFCERTISNPRQPLMRPQEAIVHMAKFCDKKLDQEFFFALARMFKLNPLFLKENNGLKAA